MVVKMCRLCGQELPISEFQKRGGNRKDYQSDCKACTAKRLSEERKWKRKILTRYKRFKGCSNCGHKNEDEMQLHFHHVDPSTKGGYGDSHAYDANWSMERIKEELAKCEVLCNRCHAHETFTQYYKQAA